jgi:ferric-dicitrate binding protein FerR (iron transport regulator)
MLNSSSIITYPVNFSDTLRSVKLSGEAFFEVEESPIPFKVFTGKLSTTVLGTAFNVRYREGENKIEVALLSGRVKVNNAENKQMQLLPSERAVYHLENEALKKDKYDYKQDFGWKDGLLYFKKASLAEVAHKLEMWYGVDIHVVNQPAENKHFTGAFENQSLKNVMESLSFTFGFNYKLEKENVSVHY